MKQLYVFTFLLAVITTVSYSQSVQDKAALLKALSQAPTDSLKIKLLIQICNLTKEEQHYKEATNYALQVLELRKRVGSKLEVANTLNFIGNLSYLDGYMPGARRNWMLSADIFHEINDKSYTHSDVLENIGNSYMVDADYIHASETLEKAVALSQTRQDKLHEAKARLFLGRSYEKLLNFSLAKENFEKALAICKEKNLKGDIAVLFNQLCNLLAGHGDFVTGLNYGYQSLRIGEQLNDAPLIVSNLNDISNILVKNREYDTALNYLSEAKKRLGKNKLFASYILSNLGTICILKEDNNGAIANFKEAITLADELNLKEVTAAALNNLSIVYSKQENYTASIESLHSAIKLSRELNDNSLMSTILTQAGKLYQQLAACKVRNGWPDSLSSISSAALLQRSVAYLQKSIALSKKINKLDLLQESYRLLANGQHQLNDNEAAFANFNTYVTYRDSVFNLDKSSAQNKMMLQYAFDKKAAEKDKEKAIVEAKSKARLYLFVSVAAAILGLSFIVFYFIRKIEKNKHTIELLALKQEALNAQISDHFISNVMDSINGFIKNNDKEKAGEYLEKFSRLIREVLANASSKMIPIENDLKILKDYLELERLRFTAGGLEFDIVVDETIDVEQTLIPPMVLQLLAENALKHGFRKTDAGKLLIKITSNNSMLECLVQDNGSGRSFSNSGSNQNQQPHRKSFGNSLAEKLVKSSSLYRHDTSYNIVDLIDENNNPIGTAVKFTFPYLIND